MTDDGVPVMTFVLKGGDGWSLSVEKFKILLAGYPLLQGSTCRQGGRDVPLGVMYELVKAYTWLESNPDRRKTKRGMMRFLNSWLSRAESDVRKLGSQHEDKMREQRIEAFGFIDERYPT